MVLTILMFVVFFGLVRALRVQEFCGRCGGPCGRYADGAYRRYFCGNCAPGPSKK